MNLKQNNYLITVIWLFLTTGVLPTQNTHILLQIIMWLPLSPGLDSFKNINKCLMSDILTVCHGDSSHRPPTAYLLHFAIIHKLSAIFTKGQWMWMGTNWPEKVIHNLSAISMKGQLFMNGYHFDDQFLSKSDT